uniref:transcription factor bHLH30-like n=1 Tax=Erigeron canadensis TaxID=72917 RepID=UPI001CB962A1|nr:transcription factor bHLH30-like [Erigeron canadensis]
MVSFHGHDTSRDTHCSRIISQESNEVAKNKISSSIEATKLNVMTKLASKKHALSERKRRKRINGHYDSLRKFFPRLLKNDKASVLTETVRHLKELKSMVANVALLHDDKERCSDKSTFIPNEKDEVSINFYDSGDKIAIQATICCEDRPELNQELTEAIRSVHGKAVKAEMATVGGRTKVEVNVEWRECSGRGEEYVGMLKRTLKAVMENRIMVKTKLTDHIFT